MITVIIADDHPIFRQGLAKLLAADNRFRLVGEASNGREALALIHDLKPDVAILDLKMPRPDGIEVTAMARAAQSVTRCIILSMREDVEAVRQALGAGAYGYVLKEAAFEEVTTAIVKVIKGKVYLGAFQDHPHLFGSPCAGALTEREVDVLRLVGRGFSSKLIASELGISTRTVESHRQNMMKKLDLRTATALAGYAREQGLS